MWEPSAWESRGESGERGRSPRLGGSAVRGPRLEGSAARLPVADLIGRVAVGTAGLPRFSRRSVRDPVIAP